MKPSIFLQITPHELAVGYGTLTHSKHPSSVAPSFYINNFILSSETPWVTPEKFEIVSLESLRATFPKPDLAPKVAWNKVNKDEFTNVFHEVQDLIEKGVLLKAVPALFEEGKVTNLIPSLDLFFRTLLHATSRNSFLFGYEDGTCGIVGLSPEVLFEKKEHVIVSSALAGTQSAMLDPREIQNSKDQREHQLVVDDIKEKLSSFGAVKIENTATHNVGALIHLRATLSVEAKNDSDFETVVKTLHPTAALGVYPQTDASKEFLIKNETETQRDLFGAPFGLRYPDGHGICIVAIRSAQWSNDIIRVGSGCGVIKESNVDAEFEELQLKRNIIKELLCR